MRKLSLLSLAGLASLGMIAAPAQSGTIVQNDVPDVVVGVGETSEVDLADFFASPSEELSFSVDAGGSIDGSVATIFSADSAGSSTVEFSASDGTDTASDSSDVFVSSFNISGLEVDDNNRIVGEDGGNVFLNGLVPGSSVDSVAALVLPEGGSGTPGSTTPGGGTGAAALIATIGSVELAYDGSDGANTGLRIRSSETVAEAPSGTGEVAAGGLTAALAADGTYTLEASDDYSGTWVVTFGAEAGDSMDAVHLVVAESTAADLSSEGNFTLIPVGDAQADVTFGADGATVTAGPGEGILVVHTAAVPIEGVANISLDYEASATAGVTMAVLGFSGGIGSNLAYLNTPQLATGVEKNLATTIRGSDTNPGFQVFNGGDSEVTVTVSSLEVIHAGPVMDYALNPNATADLGLDGSIAAAEDFNADLLGQGSGPVTLSDMNNHASATSAGSLSLAPAGDLNIGQAWTSLTLGVGTFVAEAFVKKAADAEDTANFLIHLTDGSMEAQGNLSAAAMSDDWNKVQASGINSNADANVFLVLQGSGATFMVDDVAVRVVDENEGDYVDTNLLGL